MKHTGTKAFGIRTPIIRQGDDLVEIVTTSVLDAVLEENVTLNDRDIVAITEAVVAISQGNYATVEQIAKDIKRKFPEGNLGLVFPILSRNRFSLLLKAIAQGVEKLTVLLSYPADEVGNHLVSWEELDEAGLNPYQDVLTESEFRSRFKNLKHHFTNVDYVEYYKSLGDNIEIVFGNNPRAILQYTDTVLVADVHSRERTKRLIKNAGAKTVYTLAEILTEPVEMSGYNPVYGLLGSNMAKANTVKLFPRDCDIIVKQVQERLYEKSGKKLEVMIFGDGAFKDPVGKIWELADPVVSPAYTEGLVGTPNELKLKFLVDNELSALSRTDVQTAVINAIKTKEHALGDKALGTTPRQYTDLLGSLCDLITGSGDRGTPVVLIQNYFSNYAS